jgi:hypothetical protein
MDNVGQVVTGTVAMVVVLVPRSALPMVIAVGVAGIATTAVLIML